MINLKIIKDYIKNISYKGSNKCMVLLYHSVNEFPLSFSITPRKFEDHIKYLKERFNIIDLSELIYNLKNQNVKKNSVVITFDDGYDDNLYYAKPILEKYNVPATIFICPGMLRKKKEFWWDELNRIFFGNPANNLKNLELTIHGKEFKWILKKGINIKEAFSEVFSLLKYATEKERNKILEKIRKMGVINEIENDLSRTITREELKELASSDLIEIGSHTMTHPCLSHESLDVQKYQIKKSKEVLENILGYEIKHLAYPFGTSFEVNRETIKITKEAGFNSGLTTVEGLVYDNSDPYRIPRINVPNLDLTNFQNKLKDNLIIEDIFDLIRNSYRKYFKDRKAQKYFYKNILPKVKKYPQEKNKSGVLTNILQINNVDYGGGSSNVVYDLHRNYRDLGYNSNILVKNSVTSDKDVEILLRDNDDLLNRVYLYGKKMGLHTPCFLSSFNIMNKKVFKQADIIHMHEMEHVYFNLFDLPKISSLKPVIWTLHNMWAITGGCSHSFDCNKWETGCINCPKLVKKDHAHSIMWNNKKYIYNNSRLTIVCPSLWLKNKVKRSMLKNFDIRLIYNGIDNEMFYNIEKLKARSYLGLPKEKKILMFCMNPTKMKQYPRKVYEYFKNKKDILFLFVGHSFPLEEKCLNVGYIDRKIMKFYYSASDLLIYPTIKDTFSLMVLESMACGLPIIAFEAGGIPEVIKHEKTGYIARYEDFEDFINGIKIFLYDENRIKEASSQSIIALKRKEFNYKYMAKKYLNLYNEKFLNN